MKLKNLILDNFLKIGSSGIEEEGVIRWNGSNIQIYKSGDWINLDDVEIEGNTKPIKIKRKSAEEWNLLNPVLKEGEVAFEIPTTSSPQMDLKIGDGINKWSSLSSFIKESAKNNITRLDNIGINREHTKEYSLAIDGKSYSNDTIIIDMDTKFSPDDNTAIRINANDKNINIWEVTKFINSDTYGFYNKYKGSEHNINNKLQLYAHRNRNPKLISETLQNGYTIHHGDSNWKGDNVISLGDKQAMKMYVSNNNSYIDNNYGDFILSTKTNYDKIIFKGQNKNSILNDILVLDPNNGVNIYNDGEFILEANKERVNIKNYLQTPEIQIKNNEINVTSRDFDEYELRLNYNGYEGKNTRYRTTNIYNGKQELLFSVNGKRSEVSVRADLNITEYPIKFKELVSIQDFRIKSFNDSILEFNSNNSEQSMLLLSDERGAQGYLYNYKDDFGLMAKDSTEILYYNSIQNTTYLSKDTIVLKTLKSKNYLDNFIGYGWSLENKGTISKTNYKLSIDDLLVRGKLKSLDNEVIKTRGLNGELWISGKLETNRVEIL